MVRIELLIFHRYLVYAFLMASAFKWCSEKFIQNLAGSIIINETAWHDKNIGIVVLANEMCNLRIQHKP